MEFSTKISINSDNSQKTVIRSGISNETSVFPKNFIRIVLVFIFSFALIILPILILLMLNLKLPTNFLLVSVAIYGSFYLIAITLLGQWAAAYLPDNKIAPSSVEGLKKSLLELVSRYPVVIEKEKEGIYIIKWNYANENFKYLVGKGIIKKTYELTLKFDNAKNRVLANEKIKQLSFNASGVIKPSFGLNFSFFKGISLMAFDYSQGYGFQFKNGQIVFDKLYKYKFNIEELRAPIITLVNSLGWEYTPRVF